MMLAALFDLDGTLVESGAAIIAHVRQAMAAVGHPLDPQADLSWVVGPPLHDIFRRLLDPARDELVEAAADAYRRSYDSGGYRQTPPYPAIPPVLARMDSDGWALFVATSKPAVVARKILVHVGLAGAFRAIYGAASDGVLAHKPDLVAYLLATQGLEPASTVMIGDRSFDIAGAHANRLRGIGAVWGYGGREELEQAGADALAETPEELPDLAARLASRAARR